MKLNSGVQEKLIPVQVEEQIRALLEVLAVAPERQGVQAQLGELYLGREDFEAAARHLQEAVRLAPANIKSRLQLAKALGRMGRVEERIRALLEALTVAPEHHGVHAQLGKLYLGREDFEAAERHLQEAVRLNPADLESRMRWANTLGRLGRIEEQIQVLLEVSAVTPERHGVHAQLGRLYLRRHDFEAAASHLGEAVRLDPSDIESRMWWAEALGHMGGVEERIRALLEALTVAPEHHGLHAQLGKLYLGREDFEAAARHLKEAVRLDPADLISQWWLSHAIRAQSWYEVDISTEGKLLLCCSRTEVEPHTREQIGELVKQSVNWPGLVLLARKNSVLPLLYNSLFDICPDAVPPEILKSLEQEVKSVISHNDNNFNYLIKVLKLFEGAGIPVIPFKGITFTLYAYRSLSLRLCGDIDLLVKRENFLRAKDLLVRNGFHHRLFGHAEVATVQAQLILDHELGNACVDLHYGITLRYQHLNAQEAHYGSTIESRDWNKLVTDRTNWFFYLDPTILWQRLGSMKLGDMTVRIFSPEDMLLVAVINGITENWKTLTRVCDIAELVRTYPEMNWDQILEEVRAWRFEKKFYLSLLLAHDLLNMPLPEEIIHKITTSSILRSLTIQTRRQLCQARFVRKTHEKFKRISALFTMDTHIDRVRYLSYILRVLKVSGEPLVSLSNYLNFLRDILLQIGMLFVFWRARK